MKLGFLLPSFLTVFIVIVSLDDGIAKKLIKYNDMWRSDDVLRTNLYEEVPAYDYDSLPLEDLRSLIERNPALRNRIIARQDVVKPPRPFTIASLLAFLFGGAATTTTTTTMATTTRKTTKAPTTTTTTTTEDPAMATLGTRTRRPTKYKPKGNCKKPPKKHYKEDSDTSEKKDSYKVGLEDEVDDMFKPDPNDENTAIEDQSDL